MYGDTGEDQRRQREEQMSEGEVMHDTFQKGKRRRVEDSYVDQTHLTGDVSEHR